MEFRYSFHQIPPSDFVIEAVKAKVGPSLRFLFGESDVRVSCGKKGHEFSINIAVKGPAGVYFKASATAENLYAAIDEVHFKLERQFKKNRKKIKNHKRFELSREGKLGLLNEELSLEPSRLNRRSSNRKAA